MSSSAFHIAVDRCTNAPTPMALFHTRHGEIDVVFADTVSTQHRIRNNHKLYIQTIPAYTDLVKAREIVRLAFSTLK